MAVRIANLKATVTANTSKFDRGMRRARRSLGRFGASAGNLGAVVSRGLGALVAALGIGKLISQLRSASREIDELAKASTKLGIATDRLAELQLAGKLTGVEVRTLNMGIQRMVRRISEAAKGTGEAQAAIKELGLDAKKLVKLSPDLQFREIAKAMEQVKNQSDRVRLSFKLFDSEGVALVNTLRLGEKGLNAAAREAQRLGLAISPEQAKQVERMNDAWLKVSGAISGAFRTVVADLAPAFTKLFTFLSRKIANFRFNWTQLQRDLLMTKLILQGWTMASEKAREATSLRILDLDMKLAKIRRELAGLGAVSQAGIAGGVGLAGAGGLFDPSRRPRFLQRGGQETFEAQIRSRQFGAAGRGINPLSIIEKLNERALRELELIKRGIRDVQRVLERELPSPVTID